MYRTKSRQHRQSSWLQRPCPHWQSQLPREPLPAPTVVWHVPTAPRRTKTVSPWGWGHLAGRWAAAQGRGSLLPSKLSYIHGASSAFIRRDVSMSMSCLPIANNGARTGICTKAHRQHSTTRHSMRMEHHGSESADSADGDPCRCRTQHRSSTVGV